MYGLTSCMRTYVLLSGEMLVYMMDSETFQSAYGLEIQPEKTLGFTFGVTTGSLSHADRKVSATFGVNAGDETVHPPGWDQYLKGEEETRCIFSFDVGWSDKDKTGLIERVGEYQGSGLFICFQSQGRGSTFLGHKAPKEVCRILNKAATKTAWAHKKRPWKFVCDFNICMAGGSGSKKRAMLFYNTNQGEQIDVSWITKEFSNDDE